jgi:hypothetical protein
MDLMYSSPSREARRNSNLTAEKCPSHGAAEKSCTRLAGIVKVSRERGEMLGTKLPTVWKD